MCACVKKCSVCVLKITAVQWPLPQPSAPDHRADARTDEWLFLSTSHPREVTGQRSLAVLLCMALKEGRRKTRGRYKVERGDFEMQQV